MFSQSATALTILFIIFIACLGAFIRKRSRDKCLLDFERNMVTLEEKSGKTIWGTLRVENTGLEFIYSQKYTDKDGHDETSYIIYKYEFPNIQALIRFHDELDEHNKKEREQGLRRTYHPDPWRIQKRKILNIFRTVRDSIAEIINVLIHQTKKASPAGKVLSSQDKYVTQMKEELIESVGTSFEPLLERYIGYMVVLEMIKGDKLFEYVGVLKEYTAEFIEIMDVDYSVGDEKTIRKADLIVPRKLGLVRHLAE